MAKSRLSKRKRGRKRVLNRPSVGKAMMQANLHFPEIVQWLTFGNRTLKRDVHKRISVLIYDQPLQLNHCVWLGI